MTQSELNDILDQHKLWLDSGGNKGTRADLSHTNLRFLHLTGENLSYADLRYAVCSDTNLSGAILHDANLRRADLAFADLSYANLADADLSYANLSLTILNDANLRGTRIDSAWLRKTRGLYVFSNGNQRVILQPTTGLVWAGCWHGHIDELEARIEEELDPGKETTEAIWDEYQLIKPVLYTIVRKHAKYLSYMNNPDLTHTLRQHELWLTSEGRQGEKADLSGADLRQADLSDATLREINLHGADLGRAQLANTDLRNADLSEAKLIGANLRWARLENVDLRDSDLDSADLSNADLSNAHIGNAELSNTELSGADLSHVDLSTTCMYFANLQEAHLYMNAGIYIFVAGHYRLILQPAKDSVWLCWGYVHITRLTAQVNTWCNLHITRLANGIKEQRNPSEVDSLEPTNRERSLVQRDYEAIKPAIESIVRIHGGDTSELRW